MTDSMTEEETWRNSQRPSEKDEKSNHWPRESLILTSVTFPN